MSAVLRKRDLLSQRRENGEVEDAVRIVSELLNDARERGVSDIHLVPDAEGLQVLWRIDGVLHAVSAIGREIAPNVIARIKVLAELLTYRVDIPQEGRIRQEAADAEIRVSTFPTIHGEKAVIRLFVGSGRFRELGDLGFPDDVESRLVSHLQATGGVLLACGPAGSGKTTTIYAALRHIVSANGRQKSIATLEDPVEAVIPGTAQSQVHPGTGFDYATGLKSLMRQDPDVIMVGEIRDRVTAETVFQASMTGQLALTTFHAGSAPEAVSRLCDMGIESYLFKSSLLGVLSQRLVRRLCACAVPVTDPADRCGFDVLEGRRAVGCEACDETGYQGRFALAELLDVKRHDVNAIFRLPAAPAIEAAAVESGMVTLSQRATVAMEEGLTSAAEIRRVFGFD